MKKGDTGGNRGGVRFRSHAATANTAANNPPRSSHRVQYRALRKWLAWGFDTDDPFQHPTACVPVPGPGGDGSSRPQPLGRTHTRLLESTARVLPRTVPGRVLPPGPGPSTIWTGGTPRWGAGGGIGVGPRGGGGGTAAQTLQALRRRKSS